MDAPSGQSRRSTVTAVAVALALAALGCASSPSESRKKAEPLPPQAVVPASTTPAQQPLPRSDESANERAAASARPRSAEPTLIVIDPAEPEELKQPSLAEAAARERARRREETQAVLVVTNQNLATHAAGGVLTIAHSTPEEDAAAAVEAEAAESTRRESYWRERALEIRQRWRDAADRVPLLEAKVAELRQSFYTTDDPGIRDGEIKPQWDKALADLEEARYEAAQGAEEVAAFLEEGRRAGALPGWLREGVELEPEPVVVESDGFIEQEAQEPTVYEPPPGR